MRPIRLWSSVGTRPPSGGVVQIVGRCRCHDLIHLSVETLNERDQWSICRSVSWPKTSALRSFVAFHDLRGCSIDSHVIIVILASTNLAVLELPAVLTNEAKFCLKIGPVFACRQSNDRSCIHARTGPCPRRYSVRNLVAWLNFLNGSAASPPISLSRRVRGPRICCHLRMIFAAIPVQ